MSLKITASAALALLLTSPALAAQSLADDNEINDRPVATIIATLSARGIKATAVEQWGDGVLSVEVRNASGYSLLLVDEDTLRPLTETRIVGTELSAGAAPIPRPQRLTHGTPQSLIESDDE
ncbi:hypothetical protein [Devosia sp. 1635]|uniref:hypothetical protein n=1 Tax=Devosia sp. 1635 TaxID=2726066 RepID=UPI0015654D70|nr:hypothetical protein [Devosia sp. 1635]